MRTSWEVERKERSSTDIRQLLYQRSAHREKYTKKFICFTRFFPLSNFPHRRSSSSSLFAFVHCVFRLYACSSYVSCVSTTRKKKYKKFSPKKKLDTLVEKMFCYYVDFSVISHTHSSFSSLRIFYSASSWRFFFFLSSARS
jgi:hypothetical protein